MKKSMLILVVFFCNTLFSQLNYSTENDEYILWQKDRKLKFSDFKGDTLGKDSDNYKKTNLRVSAYTGIWSILDVPKKIRQRGRKLEKVYVAPAFQKSTSFAFINVTAQIAMQQVCFDISEVWARDAREQLKMYQDSIKGYGTLYLFYKTVINRMKQINSKMLDAYTKDVYINKKPDAFNWRRKTVSKKLRETEKWATKPEEFYRLLVGKPIDENYEQSPTVSEDLFEYKPNDKIIKK